jgi:hypothetical protein
LPYGHQASGHQGIRASGHQAIRPSGHQGFWVMDIGFTLFPDFNNVRHFVAAATKKPRAIFILLIYARFYIHFMNND